MAHENLKPISTRLDPETVDAIDQFCAKRPYWKRNAVINSVLTTVFSNFDEKAVYDMVRWWRKGDYQVDAKFEILRNSPK